MWVNHFTLGYLSSLPQKDFEKFQNVSIVGEINARQFVNHVTKLTAKNSLHGKASLYDIVQNAKQGTLPLTDQS